MITVPFSLSPLQYCAGWVELYVQSGLYDHGQVQRPPDVGCFDLRSVPTGKG